MLVRKDFGTVIVTSAGDGRFNTGVRRTLNVDISIGVRSGSIVRDGQGLINYADCFFVARFSEDHWDTCGADGLMFGDSGIEGCVNNALAALGYKSRVHWSTIERQRETFADFDMNYDLIDEIWPELVNVGSF